MRPVVKRAFLGLGVLGLAVAATSAIRRPKSLAPRPAPDGAPRVVLVSIDGLRAEYVTGADALGLRIPTLRRLLRDGAGAELESVYPSVTYPAHASLVTGTGPARHRITTNAPLDPTGALAGAWWFHAREIHAHTLWDAVHDAGGTTGAVYWPVTVGARIDFLAPQIWRTKTASDDPLLRSLSSPGLAEEIEDRYGALPAEHRSDEERANAAELVIAEKHPTLTLVYFTDLDTVEHQAGPFSPEARAVLERIDEHVARLVRASELAGTRPRTTFVIASDHGFLPVHALVRPGVLLASAGLVEVDARGLASRWLAAPLPAGGTCGVVLADRGDQATEGRVAELLAHMAADPENGVARIVSGDDVAKTGGFPEASFVIEARTGFELGAGFVGPLVSPSVHRGAHGYPPSRPEMRAYLVLSGRGVRPAGAIPRARIVDVAPTIAKLLGVPFPDAEGRALDEALAE